MIWTDQVVQIARELWAGGASASEIARQINATSRSAVLGKLHRLGLKSPKEKKHATKGALVRKINNEPTLRSAVRALPKEALPPREGVPFLKMGRGCKFAVSPHSATTHLFCGEPRFAGEPYCLEHCGIAFNLTARRAAA